MNIVVGAEALAIDTLGSASVAIGRSALETQNFTTATTTENVAVGNQAGLSNLTGTAATFIGHYSGRFATTANATTFVGANAGRGITGTKLTGNNNTAIGTSAGLVLQGAATNNTFLGFNSGVATTTGTGNSYIGVQAGDGSVTGSNNVSVGFHAGGANHGDNNVFIGEGAAIAAVGGTNTIVGSSAGGNASFAGSGNTLMGRSAGAGISSGNNNVVIGNGCDVNSASQVNGICIGVGIVAAANDFSFGKASNVVTNDFDADANWSRSSDERLKKNITNQSLGLDFINDLRTVKYNWKASNELDSTDAQLAHLYKEDAADNEMNTDVVMHNFIAQEVKAALDTAGVSNFAGWNEDQNGVQQVSREMFVIPLVKAVQELSTALDAALARIAVLEG
jgi:hypothetical protein